MNITQNSSVLEKNDIAGFVLKPDSLDIKDIYLEIKQIFEDYGITVLLELNSAKTLDINNGIEFDNLCEKSDFLVTLGGDGTLISVARRGFKHQKAVLGINLGTLGFLTDIMPDEIKSFLKKFKANEYRIDHRMMIKAIINGKENVSFNDVVISRNTVAGMINLDAKIDNKLFNSYNGDGLIISTPTGSTAYNLSCNGPVVYPLTDAFIVTPISAHSLTQRPLVLPVDFKITFENTNKESAVVIIDGHDTYELKPNDIITIKVASSKAKLIHRCERNYFDVLNKKLHWGKGYLN
ncbi:MAG: NAD(+)/NADH kinase [Campylobacterota bacterium]|nr:NAD(+)/NADH kinase [Campylobacterota bacterium]